MRQSVYRERVIPSWSSFLLPPLLGLAFYAVFLQFDELLGASLGVIATAVVFSLVVAKAPIIELSESHLRVGRAVIEREHVGNATVVPAEDAFAERGNLLDARAFTVFQSSVRTMLKVEISDPADPCPYWLFSTRDAEELAKLLAN